MNKSVELNNKINFNLIKKNEIFKIYKHNISHFQEKLKQKKKIVLKTIKYPKKLINLNHMLPGVRYNDYDSKENEKNKISKNNSKLFIQIHKLLPKINKNKIENGKKEGKEEEKNEINDSNDNANKNDNKNKYFIMNTLHQQINQKNPFNNKGKIDIIIEE